MVAKVLIKNITAIQPAAPNSENDQWTLNSGRKEGLFSKRSIPAVMLSIP